MKNFLSLVVLAFLTNLASAAPYIVYSGEGLGSDFSSSGAARKVTLLYLITDVADTSSFTILQVDAISKVYTINSLPSSSPTAEEANNNFLGGITTSNSKSGIAVLSYSNETTDSNNNTFVARAYATGALTLKDTTLVAARTRPLVVSLKSNGILNGTYTFNTLTPAVTTGNASFPLSLSGVFFNYEIASAGSLAHASTQGTFALMKSPLLTELANIGGAYVSGRNSAAILPLNIPGGSSATDAYSAWLAAFAQVNGFTLAGSGNSAAISGGTLSLGNSSDYSGGVSISSGTIDLNGAGLVQIGGGTLDTGETTINGGTLTPISVITPTTGSNALTGVFTLGGSISAGSSSGTTITQTDSGATLTLNNTNAGGLTLTGSMSYTGPTTLNIASGIITVNAVNNGLIDGTIAAADLSTITFTGATLMVNGVNSGSTLTPGATVTGSISSAGVTSVNTNGVLTGSGGTLTVVTTP